MANQPPPPDLKRLAEVLDALARVGEAITSSTPLLDVANVVHRAAPDLRAAERVIRGLLDDGK